MEERKEIRHNDENISKNKPYSVFIIGFILVFLPRDALASVLGPQRGPLRVALSTHSGQHALQYRSDCHIDIREKE
jgi:hypothetical protein